MGFIFFLKQSCAQKNIIFNCENCTTRDSAINKRLTDLQFGRYQGKEVSSFLKDIGYDYDSYMPYMIKAGYISSITFSYSDSLTIDIAVSDLNQRKPLNFGFKLDIEEFEKKKISMICFRYGGRCIKGCKDEFCYNL